MAVSESFQRYIEEQLGRVCPVTTRRMFGGVGIYAQGLFFALIDDDVLYFKVDDSTQPAFESRGMKPFQPFGPEAAAMRYFTVPGEVLDDVDELEGWMMDAIEVARHARARRR